MTVVEVADFAGHAAYHDEMALSTRVSSSAQHSSNSLWAAKEAARYRCTIEYE